MLLIDGVMFIVIATLTREVQIIIKIVNNHKLSLMFTCQALKLLFENSVLFYFGLYLFYIRGPHVA